MSYIRKRLLSIGASEISRNVVSDPITYDTEYFCEDGSRKTWKLSGLVFLPIGSADEKISAPIISFQ